MFNKFFAELNRRKFLQTFLPYLGVVWLLLQVVSVVTPMLNLSPLINTFAAVVLFAGIPIMLYLSWYFDFTSAGIVPIKDEETGEIETFGKVQWAVFFLIIVSSGYAGYAVYDDVRVELAKESEGTNVNFTADSIAVLPLEDMSSGETQSFLATGISEEITSLLGGISEFKVSAFSSSKKLFSDGLDPASIGQRLDVNTVLTGSVRLMGDTIRVRVELLNAKDSKVIWSQTYTRTMQALFDMEIEIARATVNALQDDFLTADATSGLSSTRSAEAYVIYLKGREEYRKQTSESLKTARKLFEQAIAIDSEYVQAYVSLAETIALLADTRRDFGILEPEIAVTLANNHLREVFLRTSSLAEAYAVQGKVLELESEQDKALSAYDKAISLNPSLAIAYHWRYVVLNDLGRLVDAFDSLQSALSLDPESISLRHNIGFELNKRGKIDEAKQVFEELLADHPDTPLAYAGLGSNYYLRGDLSESLRYWQKANEMSPENRFFFYKYLNVLSQLSLHEKIVEITDDEFFHLTNLVQQKAYDEMFEKLEFYNKSYPDDPWIKIDLGLYYMWANDKENAITLFTDIDRLINNAEKFFMPECRPAIEIAWAYIESNKPELAEPLINNCEQQLNSLRNANIKEHQQVYLQARIDALEGNIDSAAEGLNEAFNAGLRDWWITNDPIMSEVLQTAAGKEFAVKLKDALNKEREEALKVLSDSTSVTN